MNLRARSIFGTFSARRLAGPVSGLLGRGAFAGAVRA